MNSGPVSRILGFGFPVVSVPGWTKIALVRGDSNCCCLLLAVRYVCRDRRVIVVVLPTTGN